MMMSKVFPNAVSRPVPALLLAALALSACVPTTGPAPVTPPPAAAPVPRVEGVAPVPSPYASDATAVVADAQVQPVVAPVAPATPSYAGAVDARTGMRQAAIVSVRGDASEGFTVLYNPDRTEAASVSAAPAKLCGSAGVASSRSNSQKSSSALPGVQFMIVKCGAA